MADYNPILTAPYGANKKDRRVGRGSSSGRGSTAGRGNKGQQSRSGGKVYIGFEGGQMPLFRRIAQRGFSNYPFKKEYACVNVADINAKYSDGETVNKETLAAKGLLKGVNPLVKILGNGELKAKVDVEANAFSKSAEEAIKAVGGNATII